MQLTPNTADVVPNDQPAEEADPLDLTPTEFGGFVDEVMLEPAWRRRANTEADYYDGNQLDSAVAAQLEELGIAWVPENLIGPTCDAVIGLEAKTRLDWTVKPAKDGKLQDVADAINVKLNEAERETQADRANSEAYASQIKVGLGWVEVGRESNPFAKTPYRVDFVHRQEIFWDWKSRKDDLSDARYLIRKKWYDVKVASLAFPDYADILGGLAGGMDMLSIQSTFQSPMILAAHEGFRSWPYDEQWRDISTTRVAIYEVWYRRWVRGTVFKMPNGKTVEADLNNPAHQQLASSGQIQVIQAVYPKVRVSFWVGPYKMQDGPTPYRHHLFPYIPFWGKREDLTGVPYGLVRSMLPLQDELNARRSKMMHLLASRQVVMTEGITVDDEETVREELKRHDSMVVLDPSKLANGKFDVNTDFQLSDAQYKLMLDSRESIKNVAGVYPAFQGQNSNATSGVALDTLVEQSTQSLAKINENARFARAQVGEMLMSLIIEDIGGQAMDVEVQAPGKEKKTVTLNQPVTLPNGLPGMDNAVQMAMLQVSLSDVPNTASYRRQRLMMLTELTKSLPPQLQMLVIDFVISSTDIPEKDAIVERLRSKLGIDDSQKPGQPQLPKTPQELQALIQKVTQAAAQNVLQNVQTQLLVADSKRKDQELQIKAKELGLKAAELQGVKQSDAETRRLKVVGADLENAKTNRMKVVNEDEHRTLQAGMDAQPPGIAVIAQLGPVHGKHQPHGVMPLPIPVPVPVPDEAGESRRTERMEHTPGSTTYEGPDEPSSQASDTAIPSTPQPSFPQPSDTGLDDESM